MAFLVYCDNKGCFKQQEPTLDIASNEVHCAECGGVIKSITSFAKAQMKSLGQIKKATKKAYSIKCDSCSKQEVPVLDGDSLTCAACKKPLNNVSKEFKPLIIQHLKAKSE
jgi:ribosomal protein L34E